MEGKVIKETNLPFKLYSRGKVRDIWELSETMLLMVATDRISAFDVVVGAIPQKGKILTKMSKFWFGFTKDIIKNHLFIESVSNNVPSYWVRKNDLKGRSVVVKKIDHVVPVECVVRGYLAGSGWKEYQEAGKVCGVKLPQGLKEGSKLPIPIFTPATKAEEGQHDENIDRIQTIHILAKWLKEIFPLKRTYAFANEICESLFNISFKIYHKSSEYAEQKGIIIADTKFEFGLNERGELVLIDELLTPDSSRFWPIDEWQPGRSQESFDKQYVRDYLSSIGWDKKPPAPELPEEVIVKTSEKYQEALMRLTS